jgi:hypothetical protein
MAAIIRFEKVEIGQVLQNTSTKHTDIFMKIPEQPEPICLCGVGFNAMNLNGMFKVHFHNNVEVVVDPSQRRFDYLKELIEG